MHSAQLQATNLTNNFTNHAALKLCFQLINNLLVRETQFHLQRLLDKVLIRANFADMVVKIYIIL